MNISTDTLLELAERYLSRQGWYVQTTADEPGRLELGSVEELSADQPGLLCLLLSKGARRIQLFVGSRPASALAGSLRNEDAALLGAVPDNGSSLMLYDALADDECCRLLLAAATDGSEEALRVRHVASLASHASLVFDERLFMKCYRVLATGERPEAEVLFGLDSVGFNAIVAPIARWQADDYDLALVREYLPSALEGRVLALTSLRDLLAHVNESEEEGDGFGAMTIGLDPAQIAAAAGGDLAGEFLRLGETTARLHIALAAAFSTSPLDRAALATEIAAVGEAAWLDVAGADELGVAVRLHGDYHLRRVMRSDAGWLVSGFGDDPLYAMRAQGSSVATRRGSPLEDVADMFFAMGLIAREALRLRTPVERSLAAPLALAWVERSRAALYRGYRSVEGIAALIPNDEQTATQLLAALVSVREQRHEATMASG